MQKLHHLAPALRADHQTHAGHLQLVRRALRKAPGDDDIRQRILPVAAAHGLHTLFIARARHRAGIDDVHIRHFLKADGRVSRALKALAHGLRVVLVHLAAKRVEGDGFVVCCVGHISVIALFLGAAAPHPAWGLHPQTPSSLRGGLKLLRYLRPHTARSASSRR